MTSPIRKQILAGAAAGLVAGGYFVFGRGYPWPLALMAGAAVGALVFSSLQAGDRLRGLRRRDRDETGRDG
jgi:hypothetical protein